MVPVEGPKAPGAMMTPSGTYAVPAVDQWVKIFLILQGPNLWLVILLLIYKTFSYGTNIET